MARPSVYLGAAVVRMVGKSKSVASVGPVEDAVVLEEPEHPVVVSIDPGVATGWSVIQVHRDSLDPKLGDGHMSGDCPILDNILHSAYGTFVSGGTDEGECHVANLIMDLVWEWPFAVVVLEDFVLRMLSQDRDLLSPVRMNARVEQLMSLAGREWIKTSPSTAKRSVPDERLQRWGFPLSQIAHENDARRHGVHLLKNAKFDPEFAYQLWKPIWDAD